MKNKKIATWSKKIYPWKFNRERMRQATTDFPLELYPGREKI